MKIQAENVFPGDKIVLGLKIDVDTYRGAARGVPELLRSLKERNVKATFFFSVGPDNMGRHLWRLLKPTFLMKMLRGKAAKLYGWDILLKGAFWPGPRIDKHLADTLRAAVSDGHEVALHAYDHYLWQTHMAEMSPEGVEKQMAKALKSWNAVFGQAPKASGNPGWQLSRDWLEAKDNDAWQYHSDCRGVNAGYPSLGGMTFKVPQIPTTMPTFDEIIGTGHSPESNYNDYLLNKLKPGKLNVLTVHAEVEGIAYAAMFREFLEHCATQDIEIAPLATINERLRERTLPTLDVHFDNIHGREGKVAILGNL